MKTRACTNKVSDFGQTYNVWIDDGVKIVFECSIQPVLNLLNGIQNVLNKNVWKTLIQKKTKFYKTDLIDDQP